MHCCLPTSCPGSGTWSQCWPVHRTYRCTSSRRFAYCGAFLWSTTFIVVGYGLGEEWEQLSPLVHRTVVIVAMAVVLAILVGLFIMRRRGRSDLSRR